MFFFLSKGFQLVQRSILYQTRNNANLFTGPWIWAHVWIDSLFTASQKVRNKSYFVYLCISSVTFEHRMTVQLSLLWWLFSWHCLQRHLVINGTVDLNFSYEKISYMIFRLLCIHSKRFNIQMDFKWSVPAVIIITCINKYILSQIPRWNGALIFYSATFGANLAFVLLLLNIVPLIADKRKKNDWIGFDLGVQFLLVVTQYSTQIIIE